MTRPLSQIYRAASRLIIVLLPLLPAPAQAWWDLGHDTLCEASLHWLTPEAHRDIKSLLQLADNERLIAPESFGASCTWADRIKRARPETATWHYLNIPARFARVELARRPAQGDILSALETQIAILGDRTRPPLERAEALRWVGHFVGDIHQPLHLGFARDRGGNGYPLTLPPDTQVFVNEHRRSHTNLHAVWDGYLLIYATKANSKPLSSLLLRSQGKAAVPASATIVDWANESLQLARAEKTAYLAKPRLSSLEPDYLAANAPVAIRQLARGARRLAQLLNRTLGQHGSDQ